MNVRAFYCFENVRILFERLLLDFDRTWTSYKSIKVINRPPMVFEQIYSLRHRKCGVRGFFHTFFVSTRCFRKAYTGLPVVSVTGNQKALNCVVLKYSIPVSEE